MMKKLLLILAAVGLLFTSCDKDLIDPDPEPEAPQEEEIGPRAEKKDGRIVVAYCTYYGSLVPDPSLVTNINYAFAELYVRDGKYVGFALQGSESRFKQIVDIKKEHPEIKISLSFSHTVSNNDNYQAGGFSVMASTEEGRKAFAEDCLEFVKKWGIDGIDIDWEFPGLSWSGHACDPSIDTDNHVLLMKQLRETLGNDYLLTYAGYVMNVKSVADGRRYIDVAAVDPYVDFVNIMTYDIAAGSEGQHQSAWDRPDYYWDCKRAIEAYVSAGVKPEKLILGIPFYARHAWNNSDGYKGSVNYGRFKVEYPASKGFKIDNWDARGEVPFITKDGRMWAGYDNTKSIRLKAEKIIRMGMKGMMYWDYDGDDYKGTLRNAVWNSVMSQ